MTEDLFSLAIVIILSALAGGLVALIVSANRFTDKLATAQTFADAYAEQLAHSEAVRKDLTRKTAVLETLLHKSREEAERVASAYSAMLGRVKKASTVAPRSGGKRQRQRQRQRQHQRANETTYVGASIAGIAVDDMITPYSTSGCYSSSSSSSSSSRSCD